MKYRKKPVVIEAAQLTKDVVLRHLIEKEPLPFGVKLASANWHAERREVHSFCAIIDTLEGNMRANLDDWIICGVKGELYPCKPDIFEQTYEPA